MIELVTAVVWHVIAVTVITTSDDENRDDTTEDITANGNMSPVTKVKVDPGKWNLPCTMFYVSIMCFYVTNGLIICLESESLFQICEACNYNFIIVNIVI